jgi:hypothetical protein
VRRRVVVVVLAIVAVRRAVVCTGLSVVVAESGAVGDACACAGAATRNRQVRSSGAQGSRCQLSTTAWW